jgi:cupredoxin-like protein
VGSDRSESGPTTGGGGGRGGVRLAMRAALAALVLHAGTTLASGDEPFAIHARGGRFEPAELVVPAGTAFKVLVTNEEKAPIEWESFELHRERVIQPGDTITVYIPALSAGSYKFFDDFHRDTPEGQIVAK